MPDDTNSSAGLNGRFGGLLLAGACLSTPVAADDASAAAITPDPERTVQFLPDRHLYPLYIADPWRPGFSARLVSVSDSNVADTSDSRFVLNLGGLIELVQFHPANRPDRGWQVGIEAGFSGQFDRENSEDNIGWDGAYGLLFSFRYSDEWAYRFGIHHVSSHVGDEYAERTGRQRIEYTREELRGGASWDFRPSWRAYADIAWGYDLRNDELQRAGRSQLGIEYEGRRPVFGPGWRPYIAVDLNAFEENDWDVATTVQAGIHVTNNHRVLRIGLEYYDGRTLIGEFFQNHDRWLGLGVWMDF